VLECELDLIHKCAAFRPAGCVLCVTAIGRRGSSATGRARKAEGCHRQIERHCQTPSIGRARRDNVKSKAPVKRQSAPRKTGYVPLTDRAYRELEEMIVTLRLLPGALLSEHALAQRLKIGRTPIREALQRLAREGLVVIMPRRGIRVSDIDLGMQLRLMEVRREIERLMARLAAERANEEERREFIEIADDMLKAGAINDDIAFYRLDQRFNNLVATSARNEFARRSIGLMSAVSRRFWFRYCERATDLTTTAKLHAAIAQAIAARKAKTAAAASDRLMDYTEDFMHKLLAG
jgi:DNA-binding GntR family transcriptional regulator